MRISDVYDHQHFSINGILPTFVTLFKIFLFFETWDRGSMHNMKTSDSQEKLSPLIYYSLIPSQSIPVPFLQTKHGE